MDSNKKFLLIFMVILAPEVRSRTSHFSRGYQNYISRNMALRRCNGEENLKTDIGIASFVLGGISSVAGLFALTEFSVPSNNITIINTILGLILWVPSAILTFLATSDPLSYITGNLVNVGSLLVTLYGGLGIIPGTADILVSTMDELLGITGLILSALTTFPEMYDELKELLRDSLGRDEVDNWIQGYGCGGSASGLGLVRSMIKNV